MSIHVLEKLMRGEDLAHMEAEAMAEHLADGDLSPVQLSAFLVLLRAKKETGEELLQLAKALRRRSIQPDPLPKDMHRLVDVVGTGGDGHDTVNVSTASAVVAAACGAKVAKHGNRSASSKSGAADVLEVLGVPMLSPQTLGACLDRAGVAFLFAPHYHPALARLAPIRKALGIRTVLNVMGPLLNPLKPKRMVLGVYSPELLDTYGEAVMGLGAEHALIVHCGGLDELATVDVCQVLELKHGKKERRIIDPVVEFGMKKSTILDLKGGDAAHNAKVIRKILGGQSGEAEQACFDCIALNTGAVLYVSGLAESISIGIDMAKAVMQSGEALVKLDEWSAVATLLHADENASKVAASAEVAAVEGTPTSVVVSDTRRSSRKSPASAAAAVPLKKSKKTR